MIGLLWRDAFASDSEILRRLLYNGVRRHRSLNKDAPVIRQIQRIGRIKSHATFGALHHHYAELKFSVHTGASTH